ncbi:Tripartite-type tricarboxylate transporter, receptor component TctC [Lentibacillus halodurans]|uniref:Tripartite-type tricarboxylate transporter, receptor component TctC n=1 Tax=Lentibacillus halodurans TaxID=237679 RepID=A0A1I0YDI1_9BACI|nr:hypothetical protein [Lentibacillus halodurans]SFB10263.1 Tripartite-type tricarboxylate transporter, receptor component TctC [Lentibacillus halodurans]
MKSLFKKSFLKASLALALLVSMTLAGCAEGATGGGGSSDGSFYEGESMELLVPFGTGGGTDSFARFVAPFLNESVEGNPSMQTVNVPGGGSINGANEFVEVREHNGLNALVTSASTHMPYFLGDPSVKYEFKDMKPVMGLPTGGVVYVNPETGIEGAKDIQSPKQDLVYAGISATGLDLVTLLAFEVLDMDVETILGYDGRGPSRVAFESGESNIDYQTSTAFLTNVQPLVEEGSANPLFAFGHLDENGEVVRDPAFPDMPSLKEFYVEAYGEEPSGEAWEAYKAFLGSSFTVQKVIWLHDDVPEEAVSALSAGAEKVAESEAFKEEGEEVLGGYTPYVGDQLDRVVSNMLDTDEEVMNWVKDFLNEDYGIDRFQ